MTTKLEELSLNDPPEKSLALERRNALGISCFIVNVAFVSF